MTRIRVLDVLLGLVVVTWMAWLMVGVPPAQTPAGGWAQKIFYLHVPAATISFLGFTAVAGLALGVLLGDDRYWDSWMRPMLEVSYLYACMVLLTGPFWARPVWGVWWRWEPRMTTFFILWLMYGGWFLLRRAQPRGALRRTYGAIYALLAYLNVPAVWFSIYLWDAGQQLHPESVRLAPTMRATLYGSFGVMILLFLRLLWLRLEVDLLVRRVRERIRGER